MPEYESVQFRNPQPLVDNSNIQLHLQNLRISQIYAPRTEFLGSSVNSFLLRFRRGFRFFHHSATFSENLNFPIGLVPFVFFDMRKNFLAPRVFFDLVLNFHENGLLANSNELTLLWGAGLRRSRFCLLISLIFSPI